MTALGAFGLFCLVLICFSAPVYIIISEYEKPKPIKDKNGKIVPKQDRVTYWDYLIVILPIWILGILVFSEDNNQRLTCVTLLSWGFSYLIVSPYNRRIDIPQINGMLLFISVILFFTAIYLKGQYLGESLLYVPPLVFMYLLIARKIIKLITGSFPITLDKYFRVGFYFDRYNRKATYWDVIWTVANFFVPLSFFIIVEKII